MIFLMERGDKLGIKTENCLFMKVSLLVVENKAVENIKVEINGYIREIFQIISLIQTGL